MDILSRNSAPANPSGPCRAGPRLGTVFLDGEISQHRFLKQAISHEFPLRNCTFWNAEIARETRSLEYSLEGIILYSPQVVK